MLGYIYRTTRDFTNIAVLRILYCLLVRSTLEFSSPVWSPCYSVHSNSIERIQHRALHMLGWRSGVLEFSDLSLETAFKLLPLSLRRQMYDIITLFKILNAKIDSFELLESININVPIYSLRNNEPFYPEFAGTNYLLNAPINRLQHQANELSSSIDLFCTNVHEIKNLFARIHFPP